MLAARRSDPPPLPLPARPRALRRAAGALRPPPSTRPPPPGPESTRLDSSPMAKPPFAASAWTTK
jgi:hypothetical protein